MSDCCSKNQNTGESHRKTIVTFNKAVPAVFSIAGMTCSSCEKTIKDVLSRVSGVESVDVDLNSNRAILTGSFLVDDVIDATNQAGYSAKLLMSSADTAPLPDGNKNSGCCCR